MFRNVEYKKGVRVALDSINQVKIEPLRNLWRVIERNGFEASGTAKWKRMAPLRSGIECRRPRGDTFLPTPVTSCGRPGDFPLYEPIRMKHCSVNTAKRPRAAAIFTATGNAASNRLGGWSIETGLYDGWSEGR